MVTLLSQVEDQVWKAVADGKRRQILDVLAEGPKSTGELVALFPDMARTGVMKHISVLQSVDLISVHREGTTRWNHLNVSQLKDVCSPWIQKHLAGVQQSALDLKKLTEQ